ncbi:MAG: hypothetical protein WCJ11_05460 [Methylococcaceae bacterium]
MKKNVLKHYVGVSGLLLVGMAFIPQIGQAADTDKQQTEQKKPAAQANGGGGLPREKSFPKISSEKWTGERLADGQPDVSGFWSNTIGNHGNFTDPQGGIINDPNPNRIPKGARADRAPSRVSDSVDGQVPFQPWALEKVKEFQVKFHDPTTPNFVEPLARCAPGGVPKSLYWHGYEIKQYPNYVVFFFDSGTRIIHLDDKAHLPSKIKLWNGDSRGHWEGNALVVDVNNHNGKALFGRSGEFISENGHIEEHYIFNKENTRYNYKAVFTDPTVYTKSFTVTIPARKWTIADKPDGWNFDVWFAKDAAGKTTIEHEERICTENNGGFGLGAV